MKVAFNARSLEYPTLRGFNRYAINLLAELAGLGVEIFLYSEKPLQPVHLARLPKDSYQIRIAPSMRRYLVWEQYWLPKQCEKDKVELLHSPMNFGLPLSSPCPRVLTLCDAIEQVYYPQYMTWKEKLSIANVRNQMYHWVARTSAEHIITISQHSKNDIVKYLHIPEQKITVTYLAADERFHQPVSDTERLTVTNKYGLDFPYILYVGGWEKRKNIPFLVHAFAQANLEGVKLVLAGGTDSQRTTLLELAQKLNVTNNIKLLNWVDDADLPAIYAKALCFIYPSEYEGFGLQLCEAMAVGCPVLAARATSLPEILAEGGEIFELTINELATKIYQVATCTMYRNQLVERARSRSQIFGWKKTAKLTKDLYSKLIS